MVTEQKNALERLSNIQSEVRNSVSMLDTQEELFKVRNSLKNRNYNFANLKQKKEGEETSKFYALPEKTRYGSKFGDNHHSSFYEPF